MLISLSLLWMCYGTAQTKRHLIWNRLISFLPELIKNRSLTWRKSLSGRTCTFLSAKQLRDSNREARSGPPTQWRDQEPPTLGFSLRGKPHLTVTRVDRSCRSPGSKSWDTFRPSLSQAFRNTFTLSCRSKWHRLRRLQWVGDYAVWVQKITATVFLSVTDRKFGGSSLTFIIIQ